MSGSLLTMDFCSEREFGDAVWVTRRRDFEWEARVTQNGT